MGQTVINQQSLKFYEPDLSSFGQCERQQDCVVWSDSTTKTELEEYSKNLANAEQFRHEANVFLMRLNQAYVVQAVHFRDTSVDELCSRTYSISIFLERIRLRMCDVTDVPYPDVLHLYHAALSGFGTLFRIFGYFEITERMIGISQDYKVKVWCNSNFSVARPNKPSSVLIRGEKEMVQSVLRIIDVNTDSLSKLDAFAKRTQYKSKASFKEALKHLSDYANWLGMDIPQHMERTKMIIQSGETVKSSSSKKHSEAKEGSRLKKVSKADRERCLKTQIEQHKEHPTIVTKTKEKVPHINYERYGLRAQMMKPMTHINVHQAPPYHSKNVPVVGSYIPQHFIQNNGFQTLRSISPPQAVQLRRVPNPEVVHYSPKIEDVVPTKRIYGHVRVQSSKIAQVSQNEPRPIHVSQERQQHQEYQQTSHQKPVVPVLDLKQNKPSQRAESGPPIASIPPPNRIDCKTEHSSDSKPSTLHDEILEKTENSGLGKKKIASRRTHKQSRSELPIGDINNRFLDTDYVYGATTAKQNKKHHIDRSEITPGQFRYQGEYNH